MSSGSAWAGAGRTSNGMVEDLGVELKKGYAKSCVVGGV